MPKIIDLDINNAGNNLLLKSTLNLERKAMKNIVNMLEKFDDNLEKRTYRWL